MKAICSMCVLAALFSSLPGCGGPAPGNDLAVEASSASEGDLADGTPAAEPTTEAPAVVEAPAGHSRCAAPIGVDAFPQTIEAAIELLNALPKPTSVACFVESLARPLSAFATDSITSAQPALSARSPRVFLHMGPLWLSIVLDGESSYLVEFSQQQQDANRSTKGELLLPLIAPVSASAPYERVAYNTGGTACGLCHYDEREESVPGMTGVFSSTAFRPRPETRVDLEVLRQDAASCDTRLEPHRCEMLQALFGGGDVLEVPFPETMETFY